jgi:hypothetical protein
MKLIVYNKDEKIGAAEMASQKIRHLLLCCPGPSLRDLPDTDLRRPGLTIGAINTAYPKVTPDIWFGMDTPECFNSSLVKESFIKIFRECYAEDVVNGQPLYKNYNTYFAQTRDYPKGITGMIDPSFEFVPWYKNTLASALAILIWMGVENIYLTGCDMGGDKDYHDDRVLDDKKKAYNQKLYQQQVKFLAQLKPLALSVGVNIISATKDSPINDFLPQVDVNELLATFPGPTQETVPHACQVFASRIDTAVKDITWENNMPHSVEGVLLMCDANQEWMLEWWWYNYRKFNSLPVHFVDIGMTDAGRQWCAEHGTLSILPSFNLKHWYKKPFACITSPFMYTIYMDNDCQVMGDVSPLLDYAKPVGLALDIVTRWTSGNVPVQGGVIAYMHGASLISQWAKDTPENSFYFRGDQEILQAMISNNKCDFLEMPERFNWVRGRGANSQALINHWTGDEGKQIIREQIKQIQHELATD